MLLLQKWKKILKKEEKMENQLISTGMNRVIRAAEKVVIKSRIIIGNKIKLLKCITIIG